MPRERAARRFAALSYPLSVTRDARADVWADVERGLELRAVAQGATGQVEVEMTMPTTANMRASPAPP